MGIVGILEYICEVMSNGSHKHNRIRKMKQFQTVNLKVRMDCDGCELKVKKALSSLRGVKYVEINRKQQKVTVRGYVEARKVVKRAKSTGKKAEIWPYVPYNMVAQPFAPAAYDKKAPPGFVRRVDHFQGQRFDDDQESYVAMFSDDNPNACSIM
ncbi:heavy metal-associated isoprenylated plant protein 23-like [Andrographis paniculata]|uniref:heavy metal-associated isoprenylated plant protein 23-like n=1 Tax=Andrographis paniculata TaxID=175694 RepID=UPI0021E8D46B|nr:heavy metal-associated isoprenylated plant protein 23-like [Andrographis paniculata]